MPMTDLTRWVKIRKVQKVNKSLPAKRRASGLMLRFLVAFPEGLMTPQGPVGPFRVGDLVNIEAVGDDLARVLIERGVVEVYYMKEVIGCTTF